MPFGLPKPPSTWFLRTCSPRADIHIDLGMVLSSLGFREAAQAEANGAFDLYGRKGNLAAAAQARSSIAVLDLGAS